MESADFLKVLAATKDALQQHSPVSYKVWNKYVKKKRGVKGIWEKPPD